MQCTEQGATSLIQILKKMFNLHLIRERQSDESRTWGIQQVNKVELPQISMAGKKKKKARCYSKIRQIEDTQPNVMCEP